MLRIGQNVSGRIGWAWTEPWLPLMWVTQTYIYILKFGSSGIFLMAI